MTYQIQIVQVGHMELLGACIYYMRKFDEWEPFIFTMALIRGDGKTILVNTGLDEDLGFLDPYWQDWPGERNLVVSAEERPLTALERYGVQPEDVDYILVSPLVYYATGNLDRFPNAEICLLRKGWVDFHAPVHRGGDAMRPVIISDRVLTHLVTTAWPRVRLLAEEEEIMPGVRVWYAGAHHKSTMAVQVDTSQGPAIYTDCCFKYGNVEDDIPVGYIENIDEAYLSYARIRREAKVLLPAFDPEIFSRYPGGKVT